MSEADAELVSVIIPVFNRAAMLGETLSSILCQTYRPLEIVVVDDGSTDQSGDVVRRASSAVLGAIEIRYIRQEHSGAPVARNRGLAESRGTFIQYLDSDDILLPDKIGKQVDALQGDQSLGGAYGQWRCEYPGRQWKAGPLVQAGPHTGEGNMLRDLIAGRWFVPPMGYLFRRSALDRVGGWDETLLRRQDTDYLVRCLASGLSFIHVPGAESRYRIHRNERIGMASSFPAHFHSMLGLFGKWKVLLSECRPDQDYSPDLLEGISRLQEDALVAGYGEGASACQVALTRMFPLHRSPNFAERLHQRVRVATRRALRRGLGRHAPDALMEWVRIRLRSLRWYS